VEHYVQYQQAARELACTYFASELVLSQLLDRVGAK
jgi:hypothetical protein